MNRSDRYYQNSGLDPDSSSRRCEELRHLESESTAAVVGATQGVYIALTTTIIQQTVTDELRGRVISLYWALSTAHMAFLNFGFGWAADGLGVRLLLIVPGLLWTALFLFAFMQIDTVRGIVRGRSGTRATA